MKSPFSKKEIEIIQFDRFRNVVTDFPTGTIQPGEEPDFVVSSDRERIGIELTGLYRDHEHCGIELQAQESVREQVTEAVKGLCIDRGVPAVHISIHYKDDYTFEKKRISNVADEIVKFLQNVVPGMDDSYEESDTWVNREYFPQAVDCITIHRLPGLTQCQFLTPNAGYIPDLTEEHVLRTLARKEPKYSTYRRKCDSAWLVINIDVFQISTTFDVPERVVSLEYETSFDRVYVFTQFSGNLYELRTRKPIA